MPAQPRARPALSVVHAETRHGSARLQQRPERPPLARDSRLRVARIYSKAAYCRRGHWTAWHAHEATDFCPKCGAGVIAACDSCGGFIPGLDQTPSDVVVIGFGGEERPSFCGHCGAPFPWIDRAGRIYELQNLLEQEHLDAATELTVREQLEALLDPDLSEEEQQRGWERVRRHAPGLWQSGRGILESVVSAAVKQQMGL